MTFIIKLNGHYERQTLCRKNAVCLDTTRTRDAVVKRGSRHTPLTQAAWPGRYTIFRSSCGRADLQNSYLAIVAQLYRLCLKHWYH